MTKDELSLPIIIDWLREKATRFSGMADELEVISGLAGTNSPADYWDMAAKAQDLLADGKSMRCSRLAAALGATERDVCIMVIKHSAFSINGRGMVRLRLKKGDDCGHRVRSDGNLPEVQGDQVPVETPHCAAAGDSAIQQDQQP